MIVKEHGFALRYATSNKRSILPQAGLTIYLALRYVFPLGELPCLIDLQGTRMFMPQDSFESSYHRRWCSVKLSPEKLETESNKYYGIDEKNSWDQFFSEIEQVDSRLPEKTEDNGVQEMTALVHSAAYDAESVFYLCMLFFSRMVPENRVLDKDSGSMLFSHLVEKHVDHHGMAHVLFSAIYHAEDHSLVHPMISLFSRYLRIPWFMLDSTARGGRHEFHLHECLQRLILKELTRLRKQGDDILIDDLPNSAWNSKVYYSYLIRGVAADLPILLHVRTAVFPRIYFELTVLLRNGKEKDKRKIAI